MTSQIHILYIDDEPLLLDIAKLYLEQEEGWSVITATSAEEGIRLLTEQTFDAVVSDYEMERMNGLELLKYIRAKGDAIPFIIFTGKGREEVVIEALNSGADFYLQKGGQPSAQFAELTNKIHYAVSRRRADIEILRKNDELTRQDQRIRESWQQFESLFMHMIEGAALHDLVYNDKGEPEDYVIIKTNQAFENQLGLASETVVGKTSRDAYGVSEPPYLDVYAQVALTGEPAVFETYYPPMEKQFSISVYCPQKGSFATIFEDITDRKKKEQDLLRKNEELQAAYEEIASAEEELRIHLDELIRQEQVSRINEERLKMAQEIGQTGCWEYNPETRTVWWSSEGLRIFGFPPVPGTFPSEKIEACIPDKKRVQKAFHDLLAEGREYNLEYTIIPADGSAHKVIHSVAHTETDARGRLSRITGIIQDITGPKLAEEKLRQSEQKFRKFFDGNRDGYVIVDASGRFIDANPAYCSMLGYTLEELQQMENFYQITPKHWHNWEEEEIWKNRLLGTGYSGLYEKEYIRKSGEIFPVELQCYMSYGRDGAIQYAWAVARDITERKREEKERNCLIADLGASNEELNATYEELLGTEQELKEHYSHLVSSEENLRQTKEFLESLIAIANVPIIVWDPSFHISRLNRACELLIGRSADEIIGTSLEGLFPPEQAEQSMRLLRTTQDGVRWETTEIDILHQGGSIRTILWNSATLYTADGSTPVATIAQGRDVTDERMLEYEKDAALRQIQLNLAHLAVLNDEIRNPLTIITLCADKFNDSEVIEQIIEQAQRIDRMVNQLDQRWLESETILNAIRSQIHLYAPISSPPLISELSEGKQKTRSDTAPHLPDREKDIRIEEIKAQLYSILDSIDSLIYVADMETYDLLFINRYGRSLFGDIIGQKCYKSLQQEMNRPCPFCTNHLLTENSEPTGLYQWEFQNTKTGRWFDCRDRAIHWTDGRLVRIEIATDITSRKEMEEALRESETRYRNLYQDAQVGLFETSLRNGTVIACNERYATLAGFSSIGEAIGKDIIHLYTNPEDRTEIGRILKNQGYINDHIVLFKKHLTEEPFWAQFSAHLNLEKDVIEGTIIDITALKRAEMEVSEKETWLRMIMEILPVGVINFDRNGQILSVNTMVNRIWGVTAGTVPKARAIPDFSEYEAWWPDTGIALKPEEWAASRVLLNNETSPVDIVNIRRFDGSYGTIIVSAVPIHDDDKNITGAIAVIQDITILKQTEEALNRSETYKRILIDTIPDLIWLKDPDGVYISINPALERFFGLQEKDVVGRTDYDFVDKEHADEFRDYDRRAMQADKPSINEEWLTFAEDGYCGWFETVKTPMRDSQGTLIGILGISRDITSRKRAEEQIQTINEELAASEEELRHQLEEIQSKSEDLLESEKRFRDFFNNAADAIAIHDLHGRFLEVNDVFCARLGFSREELLQMSPGDLDAPEYAERIPFHIDELHHTGHIIFETEHCTKDGIYIPTEVSSRIITYKGKPAIISTGRDISRRKRAEEELAESEKQYRSVVENASEGIVVAQDGTLRYLNPRTLEMIQAAPEEVIDRPFTSFIHPDDQALVLDRYTRRIQGENVPSSYDFRVLGRKGLITWVQISSIRITWKGKPATLNFLTDITARKKAEATIQQVNRQLSLMTSITRHDINNNISVILASLGIIDLKLTDASLKEYVGIIESATEAIQTQIEFTKIYQDLGMQEPRWQKPETILAELHIPDTLTLVSDIHGVEVHADPMLTQVFVNLLDNSVRHGKTVSEIRVSSIQSDSDLILVWEDNGVGIASDDKDLIFERGFGDNTGLGMFLVREVLMLTGMSIRECGVPGRGVRFEIQVPEGKYRMSGRSLTV